MDEPVGLRLSDHPRARRQIRAAKGWGGLVLFAVTLLLSTHSGLTLPDALLRSIELGIAGYLLAWFAAVVVWRQLASAELESARLALEKRIADHLAEQEALDAEGAA